MQMLVREGIMIRTSFVASIAVVATAWISSGPPALSQEETDQRLGTVQGARVPQPWGGKQRQVMVNLDQDALYAHGLSPSDVSTAIGNQNLIIPAGTAKMGDDSEAPPVQIQNSHEPKKPPACRGCPVQPFRRR